MMLPYVYLNGDYLPREQASLHVSDLSILRGYGVFDYFRYAGGQPRFLDDHLDRLQSSVTGLGLDLDVRDSGMEAVVHELIARNGQPDGGIRIVVTGGLANDGYTPVQPSVVALPYSFTAPDERLYTEGCHCLLHPYERQLPRVKTIDYVEGIRIQPQLRARGADYPLYVDRVGNVRESDRSNYLMVKEGVLITPADDILLGITRKHVLLLAQQLGIPTEERAVHQDELRRADEAMICSSIKGVMPITRLDGVAIAGGAAGEKTRVLVESWRDYTKNYPGR